MGIKPRAHVGALVVRCAWVGAALVLMLSGCGGTTATSGGAPSPTPTQTTPSAQVIEIQHGIGSATLGMSQAQVRQSLGSPTSATQQRNSTGPYTEYTYPDFTVAFQSGGSFSGGASSFYVKGTGTRTPEGIGVGATEAEVVARVPGATCGAVTGFRSCLVGHYSTGSAVTIFRIDGGRVTYVRVARVG